MHEVVALGALDPEAIVTPGLFVQRVVQVPRQVTAGGGFKAVEAPVNRPVIQPITRPVSRSAA